MANIQYYDVILKPVITEKSMGVQETPGNQKQADNRRGNPLDSGEDF